MFRALQITLFALLGLSQIACQNSRVHRLDASQYSAQQRTLAFKLVEGFAPPEHAPRALKVLRTAQDFEALFGAKAPEGIDFEAGMLVWSGEGQPTLIQASGLNLSVAYDEGTPAALAYVERPQVESHEAELAALASRLF